MRKPHAKSTLKNLPVEPADALALGHDSERCQRVIFSWLQSASLEVVAQRCRARFGFTQTERGLVTALSEFRTWFEQQEAMRERKETLREVFAKADANANAVAAMLQQTGASAEQMARASHLVFQLQATEAGQTDKLLWIELEKLRVMRESAEHKARTDAAKIAQKDRDLALADRRVAVLEKKIAAAQKTLTDPSLSMPEREARMKEMFGIS